MTRPLLLLLNLIVAALMLIAVAVVASPMTASAHSASTVPAGRNRAAASLSARASEPVTHDREPITHVTDGTELPQLTQAPLVERVQRVHQWSGDRRNRPPRLCGSAISKSKGSSKKIAEQSESGDGKAAISHVLSASTFSGGSS